MGRLRIWTLCCWHGGYWWIRGHASVDSYFVQQVFNPDPLAEYMADEPVRLGSPGVVPKDELCREAEFLRVMRLDEQHRRLHPDSSKETLKEFGRLMALGLSLTLSFLALSSLLWHFPQTSRGTQDDRRLWIVGGEIAVLLVLGCIAAVGCLICKKENTWLVVSILWLTVACQAWWLRDMTP